MKIQRSRFHYSLTLFSAFMALSFVAAAQSPAPEKATDKAAAIKALVESQNYVFKAQSAMPMSGRTRQLTDDYHLKVTKEKITSYLPYYGKAYTAPMDPSQSGIQFSSKAFDYSITPGKKDGWEVSIKPRDYSDVQQLSLSISSEGYASLRVLPANKQSISFSGTIVAAKMP